MAGRRGIRPKMDPVRKLKDGSLGKTNTDFLLTFYVLAQFRGITRNAAMRLFALVCGRAYTLPDQAKLAFPNCQRGSGVIVAFANT